MGSRNIAMCCCETRSAFGSAESGRVLEAGKPRGWGRHEYTQSSFFRIPARNGIVGGMRFWERRAGGITWNIEAADNTGRWKSENNSSDAVARCDFSIWIGEVNSPAR